jgi:hypothetical protein
MATIVLLQMGPLLSRLLLPLFRLSAEIAFQIAKPPVTRTKYSESTTAGWCKPGTPGGLDPGTFTEQ